MRLILSFTLIAEYNTYDRLDVARIVSQLNTLSANKMMDFCGRQSRLVSDLGNVRTKITMFTYIHSESHADLGALGHISASVVSQ
jgi:hypothetical protein